MDVLDSVRQEMVFGDVQRFRRFLSNLMPSSYQAFAILTMRTSADTRLTRFEAVSYKSADTY